MYTISAESELRVTVKLAYTKPTDDRTLEEREAIITAQHFAAKFGFADNFDLERPEADRRSYDVIIVAFLGRCISPRDA